MKFLIKGFIFRIIFTVTGFLVSLLIARFAGVDRFGILSLMIVNAAFIQIITGLGTDAAIVWHGISGKPEERNKIFSFTIYTAFLQFSLFSLAAFLFYTFTSRTILSGETGSAILFIELLYFTGLLLTEKYAALFYSQQMAALCNKLLAVTSAMLLAVLLIILFSTPQLAVNYPEWILSFFIFVPALVLVLFYHVHFNPVLKKLSKKSVRSFTSFSFIVLLTNLIQFIAFRVDFWFINYFHSTADVGVYAQASRFSQMLWIIPGVLAGLIVPALKNEKNKLSVAELAAVSRILFFTHTFFAVALSAGAYILYQFFLPGDFSAGFPALLLMIPGYIIFTTTTVLAAFFSANRLLRINLLGSSICCVLMLVLDILLIPKYSYTGAAIANSIAYTITTIYFIAVFRKQTGLPLKDYFILRKTDWKILFARFSRQNNES